MGESPKNRQCMSEGGMTACSPMQKPKSELSPSYVHLGKNLSSLSPVSGFRLSELSFQKGGTRKSQLTTYNIYAMVITIYNTYDVITVY